MIADIFNNSYHFFISNTFVYQINHLFFDDIINLTFIIVINNFRTSVGYRVYLTPNWLEISYVVFKTSKSIMLRSQYS